MASRLLFFAVAGLLCAAVLGLVVRKKLRFSILQIVAATAISTLAVGLVIHICFQGHSPGLRWLLVLGVGALLWEFAGLAMASLLQPRLALSPRRAGLLSLAAGMTFAWACGLMLAMTVIW
jgi:hypothetical protein